MAEEMVVGGRGEDGEAGEEEEESQEKIGGAKEEEGAAQGTETRSRLNFIFARHRDTVCPVSCCDTGDTSI